MKKSLLAFVPVLLTGVLALPSYAQDRDGPPPPPPPGQRERPDGPPRPGQRGEPGKPPRPEMGMQDGPPRERPGIEGYLMLVEQYSRLTRDPSATGVAAVISAADVLRSRGADAEIEYFEKILPDVKNPTIRNAIRLQLADFYRSSGKADKALDQLSELIKADAPPRRERDEEPKPTR